MFVLLPQSPIRVPEKGEAAPAATTSLKSISVMAANVATDNVVCKLKVADLTCNRAIPVVPEPNVKVPLTVLVTPVLNKTVPNPDAARAAKVKLLNVFAPVIVTTPSAVLVNDTL